MIYEIFRLLRPSIEGRDLDLRLDYDLFLPDRMIGDPGRVRQVLTNLIGNAVKFTEAGHVLVRVVGDPPPPPGQMPDHLPLRIIVEDTGIGIPPEKQNHIFGEFNQVEDETNRRHDGTGLGLAISRRLVERMGGEMWLDSEPGAGSVFGFTLQLAPDPSVAFDPVPPLPATLGPVLCIGFGKDQTHALSAALARLRAKVSCHATTPGRAERASAAAIIWAAPPDDLETLLDALPRPGRAPVCLVLAADQAAPLPQGLLPVDPAITPAALADLILPAADPATGPSPGKPEGSGRLRVLAAEDNKTNRRVFQSMLKSLDLDLQLVENGTELVAAYKSAPPDLVFSDISMPIMDGFAAIAAIRAHEALQGGPPVPAIAMTAHAMSGDRERVLDAGFDAYLTKPLKKADLFEQIARLAPKARNPLAAPAA